MSTDTRFRFGAVPRRYPDAVQRAAVLHPLMHRIFYTPADIVDAADRVCGMWRARIRNLTGHGWLPRASRHSIIYTRNCHPTFAMVEPTTRTCGQRLICPFCYARWVREVWLRVDAACRFHRPVRQGGRRLLLGDAPLRRPFRFHVVERRHKFLVPFADNFTDELLRLRELMARIAGRRCSVIQKIVPLGALMTSTIEPVDAGWLVRNRQLFKLAAGQDFPEEFSRPRGTLRRHERPSRKVLFGAVARTCRYPLPLMFGPPELVTALLQARAGSHARLSGFYGDFRGHRPRQPRGDYGFDD